MHSKPQVMVVDDDHSMCAFLTAFLNHRGYHAIALDNTEEAVRRFNVERPSAIILDLMLPGHMNGLDALAAMKKIDADVPVIVLSGEGRTNTVVRAIKLGASDFVNKPFDDEELEVPLANALRERSGGRAILSPDEMRALSQPRTLFGTSAQMVEVRDLIERVADTDVTVLIRGESGTGKELVARAIYASSRRRDKPFVKVNCAALPAELLESELFGFERGAFTGAIQQKPGKFEFANHGTIFLDEIGDMSFPLQAKLLQVLQDGEFSRLGGGKHDVRVDVRAVAATNRDLERAVADNQFREDLFFRLNVVSITLPPLRERRDEVPVLSEFFLKKYSAQYKKPQASLSNDTLGLFMEYAWPGNVRELENLVKRAVVLGDVALRKEMTHNISLAGQKAAAAIAAAPAPRMAAAPPPAPTDSGSCSLKDISRTAAREAERGLIARMLEQTRWNRKVTAEALGISYKALLYKIKENGLDRDA